MPALFLLLIAVGTYGALRLMARKAAQPPAAAVQSSAQPHGSDAKTDVTQQRVLVAGSALRTASGSVTKGEPNPATAPDSPTQPGQQTGQQEPSRSTTGGTAAAGDAGPTANAVGGLLGALSSAVGGTNRHDPVYFHTLEGLLPSSLPGMQGAAPNGKADETMSIKTTSASIGFTGQNDARVRLSIEDATAISGLAGLAEMANAHSSEQGDSYERNETIDGRSVHEKWDATARHGELSLTVGQRFAVDVVGDNVDMDALKNALARIDLARLESMKDANPITR